MNLGINLTCLLISCEQGVNIFESDNRGDEVIAPTALMQAHQKRQNHPCNECGYILFCANEFSATALLSERAKIKYPHMRSNKINFCNRGDGVIAPYRLNSSSPKEAKPPL